VFGGLTEKNIGQLKLLNTVVFPVNYNDTFYRDLLNDPALTRLALFNDVLVGAVCCRVENKTSGTGKRLYIMTLGVLAPYRKRQIGSKLLEFAIESGEKREVEEVYLHVQTSNEEALSFYKKFGFQIVETIKDYYKRIEPRDCYVLQKSLN
jgi:ribosomal protein S18 acetylase RimI-like enzyme